MIFYDRVNIVGKAEGGAVVRPDVPAHFGHSASLRTIDRGTLYVERAQVMVPAEVIELLDPTAHAIEHKGVKWFMDGQPMVRYRRGIAHHVSVGLTRTT